MTTNTPRTIRLDPKDNVVVALGEIAAQTPIPAEDVTTGNPIPAGHKLATAVITAGDAVRQFRNSGRN